jgi:hypothetical protein
MVVEEEDAWMRRMMKKKSWKYWNEESDDVPETRLVS